MKYSEYKFLVKSDLYRYEGSANLYLFIKYFLRGEGFKFSFWLRTTKYTKKNKVFKFTIYPIARLFLSHYTYKFGISIPAKTNIGSGFYIGHFGGIVINGNCTIGKNCNISQGVTLGQANRGKNKGTPILGDNIYIGPGAKIVGSVNIGNNVAIGANSVVTKNIPDNAVVVGIPGKVISYDGVEGYVNATDYRDKIK